MLTRVTNDELEKLRLNLRLTEEVASLKHLVSSDYGKS